MATAGDLVVNFLGNAKQLEGVVKGVEGTLGGVVSFAKRAMGGLAAGFGIAAVIGAAEESEVAFNKLTNAVENQGGALGVATAEMVEHANVLQLVTNFNDEATLGAYELAASFGNIKGDNLKQLVTLSADVATAMGTDITSAAGQLAKAMAAPDKAAKILKSMGIVLDKDVAANLKRMTEAGDLAGAQMIILGEVTQRYQGRAEAGAASSTILKNSIGEIAESVGRVLMPAFQDFASLAVGSIPSITSSIEGMIPVAVQLSDTIGAVASFIWTQFSTVFELMGATGVTSFQELTEMAVGFLAGAEYVFDNFDKVAEMAFVNTELYAVSSFNAITHFLTSTIPETLNWFGENWSDVMFTIFDLTSTVFINMGENIRNAMGEIWDFIASGGTDSLELAWKPLTDGFVNTIKEMPQLTEREIGDVEAALMNKSETLGNEFGTGLTDHIQSRMEELLPQSATSDAIAKEMPLSGIVEDIESSLGVSVNHKGAASSGTKERSALTAVSGMDALKVLNEFNREQQSIRNEANTKAWQNQSLKIGNEQVKLLEKTASSVAKFADNVTVAEAVK